MEWIWGLTTESIEYDLSKSCSRCEKPLSQATQLKVMPLKHVFHGSCIPSDIKPLGDIIDLPEKCYVCHRELSEDTILMETPCCCLISHAYCIQEWLSLSCQCPSCASFIRHDPGTTSCARKPYALFG